MTVANDDLVEWLLEGDPAIRWRVQRDLLSSPASTVSAERTKIATEGWGAKLLSLQDSDGRWGGGDYAPKWISTTYTLLHLLWLGLPPRDPAALAACERLWEWQSHWRVPETCIVSMLVRLTAVHQYETDRLENLMDYLLDQQLEDAVAVVRHARVEATAVGRRTPDIPAAIGFGWRAPVRAGGIPCGRSAS